MKTHSTKYPAARVSSEDWPIWFRSWAKLSMLLCVITVPLTGCQTQRMFPEDVAPYASVKLAEGDAVAVTFPSSPDLNTVQRVRRDGKIDLKTVGEIQAAGKTPKELEQEILKLYEKDLVIKEVSVMLQTTTYPVFVVGAVMRPGKVMAERAISALEAIMEAGGFDSHRANLRRVVVIRKEEEAPPKRFEINLQCVLDGKCKQLFYLRPNDIVYIPEKWF